MNKPCWQLPERLPFRLCRAFVNSTHQAPRGVTVRKNIVVINEIYCLLNEHYLLHSDRNFDDMEQGLGLRLYGRP